MCVRVCVCVCVCVRERERGCMCGWVGDLFNCITIIIHFHIYEHTFVSCFALIEPERLIGS